MLKNQNIWNTPFCVVAWPHSCVVAWLLLHQFSKKMWETNLKWPDAKKPTKMWATKNPPRRVGFFLLVGLFGYFITFGLKVRPNASLKGIGFGIVIRCLNCLTPCLEFNMRKNLCNGLVDSLSF